MIEPNELDAGSIVAQMRELTLNIKPHTVTILAGDFNARIGADGYETNPRTVGPVCLYVNPTITVAASLTCARPPI